MFVTDLEEIAVQARHTAVQACWTQWVALGSTAVPTTSRSAESLVDPESLILLSLTLVEQERRLGDFVVWWAGVGAGMTSVQRLRSLAERFPAGPHDSKFGQFARLAADAGDRRWVGHVGPSLPWALRPKQTLPDLTLANPAATWLRIRAGFGVGAKSDTLAFLLGLRGAWANVRTISHATSYSEVTIRKAVSDMTLARLVREKRGRPAEYSAPNEAWSTLLDLDWPSKEMGTAPELPRWRYWAEVFAYLAHVLEWSRLRDLPVNQSHRVLASRARDVLEAHRLAFTFNDIRVPDPAMFDGLEVLACMGQTSEALASWMGEHI